MLLSILLAALAGIIVPTIAEITLTEFQPIKNFPQSCTNAYSQTINGCSQAQDFSSPNTCTSGCVAALTSVQSDIQKSCVGILASRDSVIGQFFIGNGPTFVCSGLQLNSGNTESSTSSPAATTTVTTTTHTSNIESMTSTVASLTTSSSLLSTRTGTSTEKTRTRHSESRDTTSATTIANSSSTSAETITPVALSTSTVTSSATTSTSQSHAASTSSQSGSSGGGSPFDTTGQGVRSLENNHNLLLAVLLLGAVAILR